MRRRFLVFVRSIITGAIAGTGVFFATPVLAESNRIISVEEHWQLTIAQPDIDSSAPQTTMVMSPTGDLNDTHFLFTINHSSAPDYQPGGMQVQHWNGEEFVDQSLGAHAETLEDEGETVHWTQRLSLHDGHLTFQVVDGDSQTWHHFGGNDLTVGTNTSLSSLNGYRPAVSLSESQVNFAQNRVTSLTLTKLIWVTDDGQVHEHDAPIPIDITLGD